MFTGIVSGVGTLQERAGSRFVVACPFKRRSLEEGFDRLRRLLPHHRRYRQGKGEGARFAVDVSNETLARTTLGSWREGRRINLERALTLGDGSAAISCPGISTARPPSSRARPTATASASCWKAPPSTFVHCRQRSVALDGSLSPLTMRRPALRCQPHSLHARPHDMGRPQPRRSGKP